jgi:hypothetical protein
MTTKLVLRKIFERMIHTEEEDKNNHEDVGKNKFHWTTK